jgi:inorganic pyrophosphatase/exopolyphosphatase
MIQNLLDNCTEVPHFIGQLSFVTSYRYYVARVGCRASGLRYMIKKAAKNLQRTVVK